MLSRDDCKLSLCYRTARGDNNGTALSFVTSDDHKLLSKAEEELTKECTGAWKCSDSLQKHVIISLYIMKKMQNRTTQSLLSSAIFLPILLLSRNLFYRCERILTRRFSVKASGISGDREGIPFVSKRYTEGLPFVWKMIYITKK